MCNALHELDIRSRAAESIVDDWQGPIVTEDDASSGTGTQSESTLVRSIWTINELVALLLQVVGIRAAFPISAAVNIRQAVDDGESEKVVATIRGFVVSVSRLDRAIRVALNIVAMFREQGHSIKRADELAECPLILSERIDELVRFSEDIEWERLDKQALPLAQFKELAAYFVETGKASAQIALQANHKLACGRERQAPPKTARASAAMKDAFDPRSTCFASSCRGNNRRLAFLGRHPLTRACETNRGSGPRSWQTGRDGPIRASAHKPLSDRGRPVQIGLRCAGRLHC